MAANRERQSRAMFAGEESTEAQHGKPNRSMRSKRNVCPVQTAYARYGAAACAAARSNSSTAAFDEMRLPAQRAGAAAFKDARVYRAHGERTKKSCRCRPKSGTETKRKRNEPNGTNQQQGPTTTTVSNKVGSERARLISRRMHKPAAAQARGVGKRDAAPAMPWRRRSSKHYAQQTPARRRGAQTISRTCLMAAF